MRDELIRLWYRPSLHFLTLLLLPFSFLFAALTAVRRLFYRLRIFTSIRLPVPVVVVGNVAVGGTGKTPFTIWLAAWLREQGFRPGIISRGYGGTKQYRPVLVKTESKAVEVGDEALLLARHAGCPVAVCVDRAAAAETLMRQYGCNIIVSDDGLQHYRLARDLEIVIVDAGRGMGNGYLLPAGPLRESVSRLNKVDIVVTNGGTGGCSMLLEASELVSISDETHRIKLNDFPQKKIHAVAGIGHPERFFNTLKQAGFDVVPHVYPDHHFFQQGDLTFNESLPVVMTEKDAVKCRGFSRQDCWYLPVAAKITDELKTMLLARLKEVCDDAEENDNNADGRFVRRCCGHRQCE